MKQFILAGVSSGVGKTTVTLAVLRALTDMGYKVQPYKIGPDYIDTSYHSRITKNSSRNLDNFLIPNTDYLKWSYYRWHQNCDVAVVEGVMGLYDGLGTDKDCASSASVAKQLNLPVVLIIDGKSTSTSAAAIVHGFSSFDPDVNIVGVLSTVLLLKRIINSLRERLNATLILRFWAISLKMFRLNFLLDIWV